MATVALRPSDLQPNNFAGYPPQAQRLAADQIDLLRRLPLAFLALLLREVIGFDWKFPAEQDELTHQFQYLRGLTNDQFESEMQPFRALRLTPELAAVDWVNAPAQFSEQLSAHLWATHQIEAFRTASVDYVHKLNLARTAMPPGLPRLTMVVLGQGVTENSYRLFRKLRPHGTYFSQVEGGEGRTVLMDAVTARARKLPQPFAHWYVDGGASAPSPVEVSNVSYQALDPVRKSLVNKMRQTMQPGGGGPEALRTMMAALSPEQIGFPSGADNQALSRFQVSLLTEGSGTQLFSTTFVQWAAREILRRAQPVTLLTCYAPRQREESMQEMLSGAPHQTVLDPQGSLIDADMGAYYTWINGQRLPGSAQASFLAWFERGREAIAVGPAFARGKKDGRAVEIAHLLGQIG